ncbi:MAG: LamG domain-containing protein, partial [Mariniphaga sp.]
MKKEFYFVFVCMFLAIVSFAQEGPVVYLPLDNDLNDASGNGLHAVDSGQVATVFVDDPLRGRVAFFEETAHAALPHDDALRFGTNDFAVALWLKIDRVGSDPVVISNKDWNNARNRGFVMYVDEALTPGEVNFGINLGDGKSEDGGSHTRFYWKAFENMSPDVIDGTWHSVAASFDRDGLLSVWIDGEPQYSAMDLSLAPGMAHDIVNDYPIRIMEDGTGKYNSTEVENGTEGLSGYIDEIRIWNRTITEEEVKEFYAPKAGPVVYLPLDNDLNDASGNGLHAVDSGQVATVFVDDPLRGRVAFFEETAHAALPHDDALRFGTNDFAVALWLKIDRVG